MERGPLTQQTSYDGVVTDEKKIQDVIYDKPKRENLSADSRDLCSYISHVQLFATPQIVACQTPLSIHIHLLKSGS